MRIIPPLSTVRSLALLLALLATGALSAQFYNGSQQDFGKNRVQYQDFLWQYYRFDRMEVYFYKEGRDLARYVAQAGHLHLREMERRLDIAIDERIQFIVYNSLTDFRQSNIGITGEEQYNIGGVNRIVGTKVFVYFEGDHRALDQQVRSGIAQVLLDKMMFGGNWREVLKNSTLMNLPEWYLKGLVAHVSGPMNAWTESRLRDGILTGRFDRMNRLEGDDALLAGQAVWAYVADVYGESVIPNILYMTRVSRNVDSGFRFVLGLSLKSLLAEAMDHYRQRFSKEERERSPFGQDEIAIRYRKRITYSQFKLAPDGRHVAYVGNEQGQYKLWIQDLSTGKRRRIVKEEKRLNRIVDRSFPVLAWHPGGRALSYALEKKGQLYLRTYTLDDRKTADRPVFMLEKILSMDYSDDGRNIILSAVREGRSDLYLYYVIGNRQEQLTNDHWDDLDARFADGSSAIIFSSDRIDDTLRVVSPNAVMPWSNRPRDIFRYDLNTRSTVLRRLTDTPDADERQPAPYDSASYTYLSDAGGLMDRYLVKYDSVVSHIDTTVHYRYFAVSEPLARHNRSILEHDVLASRGRLAQLIFREGRFRFLVGPLRDTDATGRSNGAADPLERRDVANVVTDDMTPVVKVEPRVAQVPEADRVDIRNYTFLGEAREIQRTVADTEPTQRVTGQPSTPLARDTVQAPSITLPDQRNYNVNFATDAVLTQLDNSYTGDFYQPFTGPGAINPGLSGFIQMGVSDLFEDHKIIGGFRIALDLNNNDYFLTYHNLKRRMDKRFTIQRQSLQGFSQFGVVKVQTHTANYRVSWPFSELASVRASLLYRHDRYVLQSTDLASLTTGNFYDQMAGVKLEYVYDSSIPRGLNLYTGWKLKVFGEYYQQPDKGQSDMQVLGLDLRHSLRVHRDLILVNRLAGSTSLGSRRVIFFLGGVDNWLFPRVDNSIPIDLEQNYFYQTNATPMRGFYYNIRNGTSFGVFNTELRWPIFKYLLDRPIRSDFVQNFQIVGFGDLGVAWTGNDPYSEENTFNRIIVRRNPLLITLRNQREPIIGSYGFGLRTRILGYFVRADWAWGVDDGIVLPMVFHLSLSLDI